MAQMRPSNWMFDTSNEEMLLILKALGGRLKPGEVAEAKALGDRLTKARADELERTVRQLREAIGE